MANRLGNRRDRSIAWGYDVRRSLLGIRGQVKHLKYLEAIERNEKTPHEKRRAHREGRCGFINCHENPMTIKTPKSPKWRKR